MASRMPVLPVDEMIADCSEYEEKLVRAAFVSRGENAGRQLRTAKPFRRVRNDFEGRANYVWRMLCFDLCGFGQYACMPTTADFDVWAGLEKESGHKADYTDVRVVTKELDELTKRVEGLLPLAAQKGILRWGRALGMI